MPFHIVSCSVVMSCSTWVNVHAINIECIIRKGCMTTTFVEQKHEAVQLFQISNLHDSDCDTVLNLLEKLVTISIALIFSPSVE